LPILGHLHQFITHEGMQTDGLARWESRRIGEEAYRPDSR
jgi:hypothetical protein